MSVVEARESMDDAWTSWQGYLINGVFPLGRYLGCSDHSGAFLTRSAARHASDVVIKLVPTNRSLAEALLPRWKRASTLTHPHLLRLLEWGGCQLEGLPYLYLVMEYADQTLAQLLLHRAMTEDEAREMLPPMLDALAFLHGRTMVQGQLKPANILVVGDQLKLASDTVRYAQEALVSIHGTSVYDPPEAAHGISSTAGDVWGLGASVFEALARRAISPPGADAVSLPADFSPAFRELVARCLSVRAKDRPRLAELAAWVPGQSAEPESAVGSPPASLPVVELKAPESKVSEPRIAEPTISEPKIPEPKVPEPKAFEPKPSEPKGPEPRASDAKSSERSSAAPRTPLPEPALSAARPALLDVARSALSGTAWMRPQVFSALMLGAVVVLLLGSLAVHVVRGHRNPTSPAAPPVQSLGQQPTVGAAAPAAARLRAPLPSGTASAAHASNLAPSLSALHEVIPEVPRSARRTIRGHIKVWVRVLIDQDGSVFGAVADRAGPSRYFLRLAIEAAKKWTFPPATAPSRRLMQVRFDFSRDGTTAHAVAVR
jgi:serine/threonine protein kinase